MNSDKDFVHLLCKTLIIVLVSFFITVSTLGCKVDEDYTIYLTPDEKNYIKTLKKPIVVAPCPDYPPIDFKDNGTHVGLSHDYLRIVSTKTGLPLTIADIPSWADVLQAAKERKVDIVLSIQDVPERHSYLHFTKPYVRIPNVIIVRKSDKRNLSVKDLPGLHVAAVRGYAVVDYIKMKYPNVQFDLIKNESEGLMKLAFGEFDAMVVSLSTVSYVIDMYSITNLRIAGTVGYNWNLCFGVRNDNPVLFSIVSKALHSIPESKRNEIYRTWISLAPKPLYYEKEFWIIVGIVVSISIFILIGIIAWNTSLRRQVAIKTEQLNSELFWHKKTQHQLLLEKERLLITIQSIGDAFISTDENGIVVLANNKAEALTGRPTLLGQTIQSVIRFVDPETKQDIDPIQQAKTQQKSLLYHHLVCHCDSKSIDVSIASSPIQIDNAIIGIVAIIRDITELIEMQNELIKLQQFESLGILAAGIAHDFNNILTAIMGNAEILHIMLNKNTDLGKIQTIVDGVRNSVKSAQSLTSQLLTFAKGGKPIKKAGDIVTLIKDTVDFVTHGTGVEVNYYIDTPIEQFDFDEHQLSHVFRNLVLNAIQAMDNRGVLTISVKNIGKPTGIQLSDGDYLAIEIADTGKGIPLHDLKRIFDPYFTTKEKGTGLGLTTSLSIVRQHGGTISVSSSDKGAVFTVYLPKSRTKVDNETKQASIRDTIDAKVLILDDRMEILEVTGGMLAIMGCIYESATNGDEAIKKLQEAKDEGSPFNCVIVDVTIPGSKSGVDTFSEMKKIQPDIKGIVMSGYSDSSAISDYATLGFSWYLIKPFTLDELKLALHKAFL